MNRFSKFQKAAAGGRLSANVPGVNLRKDNLSEGDGTNVSEYGGNAMKKKDRRYSGGNAPDKQLFVNNISFGTTGTTGRS